MSSGWVPTDVLTQLAVWNTLLNILQWSDQHL